MPVVSLLFQNRGRPNLLNTCTQDFVKNTLSVYKEGYAPSTSIVEGIQGDVTSFSGFSSFSESDSK